MPPAPVAGQRIDVVSKVADELVRDPLAQRAFVARLIPREAKATELRALKALDRRFEEDLRWVIYATIPQKHWLDLASPTPSGRRRHAKVINEQAERYGLPFAGARVDLGAVVKALHDWLAANKHRLAAAPSDDPLLNGGVTPGLERYRVARADVAEMDRDARRLDLIPAADLEQAWTMAAGILRAAGERLEREHGSDAHDILGEALDDVDALMDRSIKQRSHT